MNLSTHFDTMDLPSLFSQHSSNLIDAIKGQVEQVVFDEIRNVLEALCVEKKLEREEVTVWFSEKYGRSIQLSKVDQNIEIKDDMFPQSSTPSSTGTVVAKKPRAKKLHEIEENVNTQTKEKEETVEVVEKPKRKPRAKKKLFETEAEPATEPVAEPATEPVAEPAAEGSVNEPQKELEDIAVIVEKPKRKPRAKKASEQVTGTEKVVVKKTRVAKKDQVPIQDVDQDATKKKTRAKNPTVSTKTDTNTDVERSHTKFGDHGEAHTNFQSVVMNTNGVTPNGESEADGVEMCRSYYPE